MTNDSHGQTSAKGQDSLTPAAEETLARELPALEEALKRIVASFDTQYTPCCSCKLKVAHSYNDIKAAEMFAGTLKKVRAYRARIEARREP
jgi:hypothetical protein